MSNQSHVTVGAEPQVSAGRLSSHDPYSKLKAHGKLSAQNLGGKFALPAEFDSSALASGFYAEGQEVRAMEADQPLVGIPFSAPGWVVWKNKEGKSHKVAGLKEGENFVLMCRPLDVQQQVNEAYSRLSTDQMVQEVRGESNMVTDGDPGILTNSRLNEEIGVDRLVEEELGQGKVSTAVNAGPVRRRAQTVSR